MTGQYVTDLSGCLPELVDAESQLRWFAGSQGISYKFSDWGGLRSQSDTTTILAIRDAEYAAAVASGDVDPSVTSKNDWRPIAPWGQSYHNYGAAFDIEVTSGGLAGLSTLKQAAPGLGLRSSIANDPGHFELARPLADVKAEFLSLGGARAGITTTQTLWIIVGLGIAVWLLGKAGRQ